MQVDNLDRNNQQMPISLVAQVSPRTCRRSQRSEVQTTRLELDSVPRVQLASSLQALAVLVKIP